MFLYLVSHTVKDLLRLLSPGSLLGLAKLLALSVQHLNSVQVA